MKIAGFTIVRNAIKYDYPVVEAITSVLPMCDEFVVAVGRSEDDTIGLIKSITSDKIRIIETVWDDTLREGGRTFALETDKAFKAISASMDWCFYIQADEVLHEKYLETVKNAMQQWMHDKRVEGLLFNYLHFYGSFDYLGESWKWYRREIRVVKNDKRIFSYRDAQGFRKKPNEKLKVKLIDAFIYHYGWVKDPRTMLDKRKAWQKFYHNDEWLEARTVSAQEFDYSQVDSLTLFTQSHPHVMNKRIQGKNWKFDHDLSKNRFTVKEKLKRLINTLTGYRIGEYKNYKII